MTTQPPNKSQPREFWIEQGYHPDRSTIMTSGDNWQMHFIREPIHVIEYKALEALQTKLEKAKAALERIAAWQTDHAIKGIATQALADLNQADKGEA